MHTLLLYIFSFLALISLNAQTSLSIAENFEKGGDGGDFIKDFLIDTDGSIYIIGETNSTNGDFLNRPSAIGTFIMKLDNSGNVVWFEGIGGSSSEYLNSIIKASDGYLYVGGKAIATNGLESISGEQSQNSAGGSNGFGGEDGFVAKISTAGVVEWIRTFGSNNPDEIIGLEEHSNGNILVFGKTTNNGSTGHDVPYNGNYLSKLWVFSITNTGNISTINFAYVGTTNNGSDISLSMIKTEKINSGYLVVGYSDPLNGTNDCSPTNISSDLMTVIKIDNSGQLLWEKYYGNNGRQRGYDIKENPDGTITAVGFSSGADIGCDIDDPQIGNKDIYVVKMDNNGSLIYGKIYGGNNDDVGYSVIPLPNGNNLISAQSNSTDLGILNQGLSDVWVFEIDANGLPIDNEYSFGGSANDVHGVPGAGSVITSECYLFKDSNNKVWIGTAAQSNNGDVPGILNNTTSDDIWIVGLENSSNIMCQWIGYVHNPFSQYREPNEPPCTFVNSGVARIPPSATNQSTYWTGFVNPNNFGTNADDISFEASVKNPSAEGGIFCYDMELWLLGKTNYAAVGIMHTSSICEQYAFMGSDNTFHTGVTHNLSSLQQNLNNFSTYKLELLNNQMKIYRDDILLRSMSYTQNLGNLEGIKIVFKGSGSCDWVTLKTASSNTTIYDESFNECNTICPSCNDILNLEQYYIPSGSYDADQSISSTSKISTVSNVEFKSPNEIILNSNFEVSHGAVFNAIIAPCNN